MLLQKVTQMVLNNSTAFKIFMLFEVQIQLERPSIYFSVFGAALTVYIGCFTCVGFSFFFFGS